MHLLALAVDYDGTIAENGFVSNETIDSLLRIQKTGRKLIMVTGRQLVDLQHACKDLDIFDFVVAENGAVLYLPKDGTVQVVGQAPPRSLVERLSSENQIPVSVGHSVVATWHPHELAVVNAIHDLGLELQIIFNKDAIMILPANVNKATGLELALKELDISPLSVAGCGDAENDHSFLKICGCSAAVANALPALKEEVDIVLEKDHGRGVVQLIERIIEEDDGVLPLSRRGIAAGTDRNGKPYYIRPDNVVLVIGNSGCGKSNYLTLLTERMVAKRHEFCVIDPEGDYLLLENAATIGGLDVPPSTEEALRLLLQAGINVVVNTMALNHSARKRLFAELMPSIRKLRERSGRPQWLVIDEAHYALPMSDEPAPDAVLAQSGAIIATINPGTLSANMLREVDTVIAMGATAEALIAEVAQLTGRQPPGNLPHTEPGEFLIWPLDEDKTSTVRLLGHELPEQVHNRHSGKYATGDVGLQRSFYFQGLQSYAHNLKDFLQMAQRLDDRNWNQHLQAGDYSVWFRNVIRDDTLAEHTADIEGDQSLSPLESRQLISDIIHERYAIDD